MPTPDHAVVDHVHHSLLSTGCANAAECGTLVDHAALCFLDSATGRVYCLPCGQRLRYHRKKALERGETMPETITAANERLAR